MMMNMWDNMHMHMHMADMDMHMDMSMSIMTMKNMYIRIIIIRMINTHITNDMRSKHNNVSDRDVMS